MFYRNILIILILGSNTLLSSEIDFTKEELTYLENKKTINMCVDPNWMPFEKIDKDGKYIGILSEYPKLFSKRLNLEFSLEYTKDFIQSKKKLTSGVCDIIVAEVSTKNIGKYYLSTKPYFISPRAFVTHNDTPWVRDFSYLIKDSNKIGVVKSYPTEIILKNLYKDIEIVSFKNQKEALKAVSSKDIIAFVNVMPSIAYGMQVNIFSNIKIAGYLDSNVELSVLINKDLPLLVPILNKTIESITEKEKLDIFDKWIKVNFDKQVDYELIQNIIIGFLLILFMGALWLGMLRKNNAKLTEVINSTIEGVIIFKDRVCIDANMQAIKLFGYKSLNDMKGKNILAFVSEPSQSLLEEKVKLSTNPYEIMMQKKDGTVFPSLARGVYLKDKPRIGISTMIDLSELKLVEEKLESLNQTLEDRVKFELEKNRQQQLMMFQQSRLAQMGEMLNMIAHQWRQPLSGINALVMLMDIKISKQDIENKLFLEKEFTELESLTAHMSNTIDDFRDFFKPEKEKVEFSLNKVLDHTITLLKPVLLHEGISISIDYEEKIEILGYPNELGQVIINIISNAKDELVSNNSNKEKSIHIALHKEDTKIILRIEDNAGGINDKIINSIFNPYFSTKLEKNGTGLGLYISKIIIEEHMNGKLTVSNRNDGALFKIEFNIL